NSAISELRSDVAVGWHLLPGRLPVLGIAGALLTAFLLGGLAWWRHWVLRLLLWCTEGTERRLTSLLDEATQRILLRRTSGGYRFFHDLFRDYLASLSQPSPSRFNSGDETAVQVIPRGQGRLTTVRTIAVATMALAVMGTLVTGGYA